MARGKDVPTQVGGQIDPYVQQSTQQGKQLAESRLVSAMQEAGATQRTAMQEAEATQRTAMQEAGATNRANMQAAAQAASDDKRTAADIRSKREDRKFSMTMQETSQNFQAKQAQLNRDQQKAIISGNRKAKDEIEKRREALRRFNIELNMDASERNTNATLSIIKGGRKKETVMEKAKTVLEEEATRFDKDKDVYNKTKERVMEAIANDKRMDLPIPGVIKEKVPSKWDIAKDLLIKGPILGGYAGIQKSRALRKEVKEGFIDPMGVLQDQITKYGGNISVEEMAPGNINKIEAQIKKDKIKTGDINGTLGVLEGMLEEITTRRTSVDRDSDEFDFWQDTYLNMSQMRDDLEGLVSSEEKIVDSETETVGARVQYALGTVQDSSLGGRAARLRELVSGDFEAIFEEMTKPLQVPKLYDITGNMNKYDVEYRTWFNDYLSSRHPDLQGEE